MDEREFVQRLDGILDSLYVADSIQFEEEQRRIEVLRTAGDSVAADEIESGLRTPRPPAERSQRELQARDLPKRVLYVLLADTLVTDRPYDLSVAGVTNINGVPGGGSLAGGPVEVLREAPQVFPSSNNNGHRPGCHR